MRPAAVVAVALTFAALACGGDSSREPARPPRVAPVDPAVATRLTVLPRGARASADGAPILFVDVVATHADRRRGLGGRAELPAKEGMLFVYPAAEPRTFWMKDCAFALDIAFLDDDARVLRVSTVGPGVGVPLDQIPRAASGAPARYVLEANAGFFAGLGVGTGDRVELGPAIAGVVPE